MLGRKLRGRSGRQPAVVRTFRLDVQRVACLPASPPGHQEDQQHAHNYTLFYIISISNGE